MSKRKLAIFLSMLLMAAGCVGSVMAQGNNVVAELVAASTLTKATKAKELRVGWASWFPFMYRDPKTEKLTGFSVDLYDDHLAKDMGVKTSNGAWRSMCNAGGSVDG